MIHSIRNNILIIIEKIGQFIYNKIIIYFSRKFIHMYIRTELFDSYFTKSHCHKIRFFEVTVVIFGTFKQSVR